MSKWTSRGLIAALVACGIAFFLIVFPTARPSWMWQPVGDPSEYDNFNGVCARRETTVPNGRGMVATLRRIDCTGAPIVPPSRDYFVFVHETGVSNSRDNLVFRCREGSDDPDWSVAPKLAWNSHSLLTIARGVRPTQTFNYPEMMRTEIGGIRVTYLVGGEKISPDYPFRSDKGWRTFQ